MSVSKMAKIQLTVVKDAFSDVINVLHTSGAIEVETIGDEDAQLYLPDSNAEYWQGNTRFALDLLNEMVEPEKQTFIQKLQSGRTEIDEKGIEKLLKTFEYKKIIKTLEDLDKDYNTVRNTISQDKKETKFLKEWRSLPQIEELERKYVMFRVGTVPVTRYQEFKEEWQKLKLTELVRVDESNKEVKVVLSFAKELDEKVGSMFEEFDFKTVEFELEDGVTIEKRLKQLEKAIEVDTKKLDTAKKEIQKYGPEIKNFEILYDHLTWRKEQDEAAKKALATKQTVSLLGWVPDHQLEEIEKKIKDITTQYVIDHVEVDEEESIPVVLQNKTIITPFESVTEIYGAPQSDEPDPTIYLAPFFILYFGLCLTDAGYGLLLAILSYAALKVMKPRGGAKKLMNLMLLGGIATFIIGAFFGGWFGIVIADLPNGQIKDFVMSVRLIDPVENPMSVLVLSFILGYIQMLAGNVVNMVWKIRHGAAKEGLMSGGMWTLFLLIIGFWIATAAGVLPETYADPAKYLLFAGIGAMVLTQGYQNKSLIGKLFGGIASLYGLVGYLSDILSYSRLLALGLSTGIIAMVVNLVADLFAGMVPYVGWLVWIVIIVGGHLFNLAINVLGAFIHSGRLQYVEYFPKFLVGGGRKFKPLVKTTKYITSPEQI